MIQSKYPEKSRTQIGYKMKKKEAADYLGVSTRAIERYTSQGKLSVKYEKGKTRPITIYDPNELKKLKEEA